MNDLGEKKKTPNKLRVVLLALLGLFFGVFAILFMIVNSSWVVVRIPSAPWSPDPAAAVFESRLAAVILVSFVLGSVAVSVFWRLAAKEQRKREKANLSNIEQLNKQLEKVDRLVASLREKE